MDRESFVAEDESRLGLHISRPELDDLEPYDHSAYTRVDAKLDRQIALVESRTFIRECMHRGLQAGLSLPVATFSSLSELEAHFSESISIFLLSLADTSQTQCVDAIKFLSTLGPGVPIVVLSNVDDMELAKTAVNLGAKGYIPCTTSFDIAIEVVRFILAGGTYIPMDYMFASNSTDLCSATGSLAAGSSSSPSTILTSREISVVQAIQEGKSNKVIAYKLCICEGTVKVHLRNIMKKLNAKNRTEVAIKAQTMLGLDFGRLSPKPERSFR